MEWYKIKDRDLPIDGKPFLARFDILNEGKPEIEFCVCYERDDHELYDAFNDNACGWSIEDISQWAEISMENAVPCQECSDTLNNQHWNKFWKWCPWCGRKISK